MYVAPLGPRVPKRGNAFSRWFGRTMITLTGWRLTGTLPDEPKFVIIVAPHTSNWDFPVGLFVLFALGFRGSFLAKHTLFKWPIGGLLRWIGGIPVERGVHKMRVRGISDSFLKSEKMILVITPEGTRKYVKEWKSGFYYIADAAKVPVVPVAFDYAVKETRIGPPFMTTGDREADIAELKKFFRTAKAKIPANYAP
jgi:1-acyl-sn-glycerol-3-phosphate acyltransferase